jgi:hypothetical protein
MRSSPLLYFPILLSTVFFALACEEDPGRSFLSAGSPEPVGDIRTTQRAHGGKDEKTRALLADPRIDDKEPVDVERAPVDAGVVRREPVDRRPFDVGRPPVLDAGTEDPRSLDAGPDAR